ncbi:MAG: 2-oxo-4-hydroxy-4-carboxy--5-ureidoimidazoline decarboxylase [Cyanobacteria bacterium RYN_339]|nr:2-oxo-4-hydroxy-4-carboxy--5-ureidoimidazoline decarboxylase [Cyanobacteria bacterium RYN_339]
MNPTQSVEYINSLRPSEAFEALERCCGAHRWVEGMVAARPFSSPQAMFDAADRIWKNMGQHDIHEAFSHHPRIGQDVASLRKKFASTAGWASQEQAGAAAATEETLQGLAQGNRDYEAKFGHIFIVCASGKSAAEMLGLLQARLGNEQEPELAVAAEEQRKITRIRLEKLLTP